MNSKSIFVTATGTDVGKTYISGLLVKALREKGINCGYYKPALSGAVRLNDGSLLPGDADFVVKTSGLGVNPSDCVTYCFEEAVSPHLAAERAGVRIEIEKIKSHFSKLLQKYDILVVEGAGGITCPFNLKEERILLPDVIKSLNLDTVLVADAGLGTINSILLTYEYAKIHGINIVGIIYNNYEPENFMHTDNIKQVEILTGLKTLAKVKKGDTDIEFLV
jgi:dethiobiotin synthetase